MIDATLPFLARGSLAVAPRRARPSIAPLPAWPEAAPAPEFLCLHDIFTASAQRTPRAPAVFSEGKETSYADLDRRSDVLARCLIARGVGPGAAVGVLMERSVEAYAALLAVLKAGAAYVGLDLSTPTARVATIAEDCAMAFVFIDKHGVLPLPGSVEPLRVDSLETETARGSRFVDASPLPTPAPDDLCYIIYTSGSTGKPKGVAVEHRAAAHYVCASAGVYGVTASDRVWQGFSLAFDASVEEIWSAFAAGACVVSGTREQAASGPLLAGVLIDHEVTVFSCVPTTLSLLEQDVPSVRLLIVGGEACPPELVTRWARPWRRMLNTYGPTEATVVTTWTALMPGRPVTIGQPLPGYHVLLLDDALNETVAGATGQIYIGGPCLARGYVNLPALTVERFIENPYGGRMPDAPRLYATGDLASATPDGDLIFHGRQDGQVKMRGFRIELGEIESALLAQAGVSAAAAAVHERATGQHDLVAYVVLQEGAVLDRAALVVALRAQLPPYMLPTFIEALAAPPVGVSGKIDRARLAAPRAESAVAGSDFVAPEGALEEAVAEAYARVLGRTRASAKDDFFLDLGGHSLTAALVVRALRVEQGARLDVPDLYAHPTVRGLAALIMERIVDEEKMEDAAVPIDAPPTSRLTRTFGAAAQAVSLYPLFMFKALPLLLPFVVLYALNLPWPLLIGALVAFAFALGPLTMGLALAAKWLLIGRYRAGDHPLWGSYYLRWWLVQQVEGLVPLHLFAGSPLLTAYARLMGARIGRGAYLATTSPIAWDLLDIGEGASVGDDASASCYAVSEGRLFFGPVRIGRGAYVGARASIALGAVVEEGAMLDAHSLLGSGQTIPAGQRWGGSPARRLDDEDADLSALRALPSRGGNDPRKLPYALTAAALSALPLVAGLPELPLVWWGYERLGGVGLLLVTPPSAVLFVLTLSLLLVAVKRLMPPVRLGVAALDSPVRLRHWAVDRLLLIEMENVPTLFGTLYAAPWLRLLGARIGRRSEVSTVAHFAPDLVSVGPGSFLADDVHIHTVKVCAGYAVYAAVKLGASSFIGNSASVSLGADLPDDCLVGVLSTSPVAATPGSSWLGSPSIALPRRQIFDGFDETRTVTPPRRLVALRLAIEACRVLLPAIMVGLAGAVSFDSLLVLYDRLGLAPVVVLAPVVEAAWGSVMALIVVGLKWLLVGRYRPRVEPLWSHFVWRSELVTGLYEAVAIPLLLDLLGGTPFAAPYLRLLGAKIGKRIYFETLDMTEFDLIVIGDDAALGHEATLQTHLFEDRIMKMDELTIGPRCVVGARSVVLYGTEMQRGAVLAPFSLMMKAELFGPDTRWAGIPARQETRKR